MQIVTINIPTLYIDALEKLTSSGLFPSRSEAIRVALRDFLKLELGTVQKLFSVKEENKEAQKTEQRIPKTQNKRIDMRSIRAGWA